MSELVQKQRQYTFEEICPEWAQIFKEGRYHGIGDLKHRELADARYCVMGEAFGDNSERYRDIKLSMGLGHSCKACAEFDHNVISDLYCSFIEDVAGNSRPELRVRWIDAFVRHMNEEHRDVLEARLGK